MKLRASLTCMMMLVALGGSAVLTAGGLYSSEVESDNDGKRASTLSQERERREERGTREKREGRGEHSADKGGRGKGEEDGTQLRLSDTYNVAKNGAHLVMKWDAKSKFSRAL